MGDEAPLAGAWVVSPWPSTLLLLATLGLAAIARGKWPRLLTGATLGLGVALYAWYGPATLASAAWLLTIGFVGVRRAQGERPMRALFVVLLLLPVVASNVLDLFGVFGMGLKLAWPLTFVGTSYLALELVAHVMDATTMDPKIHAEAAAPLRFFEGHALFAKALAGPICRAKELGLGEPQLRQGLLQLCYGAVLKLVVSDNLWAGVATLDPKAGVAGAWAYGLAYVVHLYLDFAGYSHMAIGAAAMLGHRLPPNFQQPFLATSISDFWRRWHMTLSFFLRDYVFGRLARRKWLDPKKQALLASFLVMVICGAWHGFAPGFLLWGALHGAAIVVERIWVSAKRPVLPVPLRRLATWVYLVLSFLPFAFPGDLQFSAVQAAVGIHGLGEAAAAALPGLAALVAVTVVDHAGALANAKYAVTQRLTPELVAFSIALAAIFVYALGFSGAQFIYAGF